ncbi:MAG: hypothetical protein J6A23_10710, partial [Thermoguttaceae bacterium]|nr:hypothetical protein [Thermoguttaceae bacterium]
DTPEIEFCQGIHRGCFVENKNNFQKIILFPLLTSVPVTGTVSISVRKNKKDLAPLSFTA